MISKRRIHFIACFFVALAFATLLPNGLFGSRALFATDFSHNLIHLLVGFALAFTAYFHFEYIARVLRIIGFVLIGFAVLGAWTSGAETGKLFGFITVNGVGHVFNMISGVLFVIMGTYNYRRPLE